MAPVVPLPKISFLSNLLVGCEFLKTCTPTLTLNASGQQSVGPFTARVAAEVVWSDLKQLENALFRPLTASVQFRRENYTLQTGLSTRHPQGEDQLPAKLLFPKENAVETWFNQSQLQFLTGYATPSLILQAGLVSGQSGFALNPLFMGGRLLVSAQKKRGATQFAGLALLTVGSTRSEAPFKVAPLPAPLAREEGTSYTVHWKGAIRLFDGGVTLTHNGFLIQQTLPNETGHTVFLGNLITQIPLRYSDTAVGTLSIRYIFGHQRTDGQRDHFLHLFDAAVKTCSKNSFFCWNVGFQIKGLDEKQPSVNVNTALTVQWP